LIDVSIRAFAVRLTVGGKQSRYLGWKRYGTGSVSDLSFNKWMLARVQVPYAPRTAGVRDHSECQVSVSSG